MMELDAHDGVRRRIRRGDRGLREEGRRGRLRVRGENARQLVPLVLE